MAYVPHHLLQFGGRLGTVGEEIWSCGIRMVTQNESPLADVDEESYLDEIAVPGLTAFIEDARTLISSSVLLTFVKFNEINSQGRYADSGDTHERFLDVPVAGGRNNWGPFQCSVVYTWNTLSASRGPGSHGRIYVPGVCPQIRPDNGLFEVAEATAMANAGRDLLNSLDDSVGISGQVRPHIVSNTGSPGPAYEINSVSVDNRVDIMRSRANAQQPARQTSTISY